MEQIALRSVDIVGAHAWYRRSSSLPDLVPSDASFSSQGNTWDFMKALVNLNLPSKAEMVPDTFLFDKEQVVKLRSDLLDLINLEICMCLYRSLDAQTRQKMGYLRDDTPVNSSTSSPNHGPTSPRLSLSSTASTPESHPPTPLYLSFPVSDYVSQARNSLQAILASPTTAEKWRSLFPSLALEIIRLTKTPLACLFRNMVIRQSTVLRGYLLCKIDVRSLL